jgi:hypothetical protein
MKSSAMYATSITQAYFKNRVSGQQDVPFERDDLFVSGMNIKNIGDVPHAFKVGRQQIPGPIAECAPHDKELSIIGTGISHYKFLAVDQAFFAPDLSLPVIKMSELVLPPTDVGALDEQGVLAQINRNNLVGPFMGLSLKTYQTARKMGVHGIGQILVDELSIATDVNTGETFSVPIGAKHKKSGKFPVLGWSQITQDIAACRQLMPDLSVRAVGVIALKGRICLMEFEQHGIDIVVVREKHFSWI